MGGLAFVRFIGFLGLGLFLVNRGKAKRRSVLGSAAHLLGGTANEAKANAVGALHGIATTFQLASRGSGSSSEAWTYIDCVLPAGYPLSLNLRRHGWFDSGKIERGELVDVQFGDAPFDDAFLVEGAPADVVRHMFDAAARAWLVATKSIEVTTETGGVLRLAIRGWLETPEKMQPALDLAARVAAGVRDATAAADRAVPLVQTDSPYRPAPDARPLREAREARAAEVAALDATRKQRAANQQLIVFVIIGVVVFAMLIGFLSAFAH
jgi:hypothetical protein